MAISRIVSQDTTASTIGTGNTVTYPAIPTKGNLLVVAISNNDGFPTISSPGWSNASFVGTSVSTAIFYKVAGVSEPRTVTFTDDISASYYLMAGYEYTGFSGVPTLDQTSTSINAGPTATILCGTTPTTKFSNELLIAAGIIFATNTLSSWSNSFVARNTVAVTGDTHVVADLVVASTGAYTTTATTTPNTTSSQGTIATFYGDTRFTVLNKGLRPHPFSPGLAR